MANPYPMSGWVVIAKGTIVKYTGKKGHSEYKLTVGQFYVVLATSNSNSIWVTADNGKELRYPRWYFQEILAP